MVDGDLSLPSSSYMIVRIATVKFLFIAPSPLTSPTSFCDFKERNRHLLGPGTCASHSKRTSSPVQRFSWVRRLQSAFWIADRADALLTHGTTTPILRGKDWGFFGLHPESPSINEPPRALKPWRRRQLKGKPQGSETAGEHETIACCETIPCCQNITAYCILVVPCAWR